MSCVRIPEYNPSQTEELNLFRISLFSGIEKVTGLLTLAIWQKAEFWHMERRCGPYPETEI